MTTSNRPTLRSFDIAGIKTPEDGLKCINSVLTDIRLIVSTLDMSQRADREYLNKLIAYVKQYYERVDMLLAQEGR